MDSRYRLYGVLGSPYAAKLRAIFRYRRIPFDWMPAGFDWSPGHYRVRPELQGVEPRIIPIVRFPEGLSTRIRQSSPTNSKARTPIDRSFRPTPGWRSCPI